MLELYPNTQRQSILFLKKSDRENRPRLYVRRQPLLTLHVIL